MRGQSRETGFYQTPRRAPAPVGTARNLPSNAQPATAGGLQAIGRQEMWSPPKEKRPLRRRSPVYTPKPAAKKPEPKPKKRRGSGRKKPFKPRDVGVAWESAPEKATRLSREEASRRELAGQAGNRYGPSRGESQARIAEYNRRMASYKKNPGISPPPKFRTAAERAEWIRQQAFNERQRKRGLRK